MRFIIVRPKSMGLRGVMMKLRVRRAIIQREAGDLNALLLFMLLSRRM